MDEYAGEVDNDTTWFTDSEDIIKYNKQVMDLITNYVDELIIKDKHEQRMALARLAHLEYCEHLTWLRKILEPYHSPEFVESEIKRLGETL